MDLPGRLLKHGVDQQHDRQNTATYDQLFKASNISLRYRYYEVHSRSIDCVGNAGSGNAGGESVPTQSYKNAND